MKSKNKIVTFGLIAVAATASVVGISQLISRASITPIAEDVDYTIAFNSTTKFADGAGTHNMTSGGGGSTITFDYSGFSAYKDGWNTIATDGYIRNKKTDVTDVDNGRITNLKSLSLTTKSNSDVVIKVYSSKNCSKVATDVNYSENFARLYKINGSNEEQTTTINFEGHPDFFKLSVVSGSLVIVNMSLVSDCNNTTQQQWDLTSGALPSKGIGTILYGMYPQTRLTGSDEHLALIDAIEKKIATMYDFENNQQQYVWIENSQRYFYRVKNSASPLDYSYFSVDPIEWKLVDSENKIYDSTMILDAHNFTTTWSENLLYKNSDLRKWLTNVGTTSKGVFLNQAFGLNSSYTALYTVSDIFSESSKNRIWCASDENYKTWYPDSNDRAKQVTDYAKFKGVAAWPTDDPKWGSYWTSHLTTESGSVGQEAWIVNYNGETKTKTVSSVFGVAPCFQYTGE